MRIRIRFGFVKKCDAVKKCRSVSLFWESIGFGNWIWNLFRRLYDIFNVRRATQIVISNPRRPKCGTKNVGVCDVVCRGGAWSSHAIQNVFFSRTFLKERIVTKESP